MLVSKHLIISSINIPRLRKFSMSCVMFQNNSPSKILRDTDAETSLWFTTLPHKRKNALTMKKKERKPIPEFIPRGTAIIQCKHSALDYYAGQRYGKFEAVPLASKGWHHSKSAGDHFTINPTTDHPAFLMSTSDTHTVAGTFDEAGLDPWLSDIIQKKGVAKLTTIQAKTIPRVLAGRNTLVVAETGCGKTMAYLLPMIQRCAKWKDMISDRPPNAPLGIIIVPNRELAIQVGSVARDLCDGTGIKCQTVLGGHTRQMLLRPEMGEVDIVVATLGVLSKLSTHRQYYLRDCKHLVLDEADTLLDDSFNEKMLNFMKRFPVQYDGPEHEEELPHGTQVTLVSATMPTSIEPLLGKSMSTESLEKISTKYLHRVLPHVPQTFLRVRKLNKAATLLQIVKQNMQTPTMIFSNTATACDWVSLFLNENGVPCERVHSKMMVDFRLGKYQRFVNGEFNFISCTDLTSRGIDTTRVKHVINCDFPLYMADYIHRCGRTGRIGHDENCKITNLISSRREVDLVHQIETAARTFTQLHNVNNNISRIIHHKKEKAAAAAAAAATAGEDMEKSGQDPLEDEKAVL